MLNIKPDVLLYPGRQARLVKQIRAAAPDQVGIFTRWSYDPAHPRPWVAPIYLHSKLAVIDDTWATIGSANLDGLSLDHNVVLSPLAFGETTAAELNVTILEGTPGASGCLRGAHPPPAVGRAPGVHGRRRHAQRGGQPADRRDDLAAAVEAGGLGLAHAPEERHGDRAPRFHPRVPRRRGRSWSPRASTWPRSASRSTSARRRSARSG